MSILWGVTPELENAGEAEILGFELDMEYQLTNTLGSRFTLGYLDTEYSDLELADASGDPVDLSGNRLISAPSWNITAGIDYRWWLNSGASLTVILDMNFQSDQYFSAYNDKAGYEKVSQRSYSVFNGQLSYERNNWQVRLWGKNLLDKEYDTYALGLIAGLGFDMYTRGTPRTFGAAFSYQF